MPTIHRGGSCEGPCHHEPRAAVEGRSPCDHAHMAGPCHPYAPMCTRARLPKWLQQQWRAMPTDDYIAIATLPPLLPLCCILLRLGSTSVHCILFLMWSMREDLMFGTYAASIAAIIARGFSVGCPSQGSPLCISLSAQRR